MLSVSKKTYSDIAFHPTSRIEKGSWINMIAPTLDEISMVSEKTGIDASFLKRSLDPDETPHIEVEDGIVLIVIRAPFLNGELKQDTHPLSIIVSPSNIITVSLHDTSVLKFGDIKSICTSRKTRFVLQIMSKANIYYQKHLLDIERKIERIEKSLLSSVRNQEIIQLLALSKSLTYMSTSIISNEKVLERLLSGRILPLNTADRDLLESLLIDNKQSVDMANIYINILTNTMDAYASLVSNNLNIVMKFLESVPIVMAIPSIISSFYGMNVPVPLEGSPHAFLSIVILTVSVTGAAIMVFMKKGYF